MSLKLKKKNKTKKPKKILSKLIDEEDLIEDKGFKKGYNSDNNSKNKKGLKNNDSLENEFDLNLQKTCYKIIKIQTDLQQKKEVKII